MGCIGITQTLIVNLVFQCSFKFQNCDDILELEVCMFVDLGIHYWGEKRCRYRPHH